MAQHREHSEAARRSLIVASDELTKAIDACGPDDFERITATKVIIIKRLIATAEHELAMVIEDSRTQGGD